VNDPSPEYVSDPPRERREWKKAREKIGLIMV